jgi:peptidyl-prolyl cis-trans isomerase C
MDAMTRNDAVAEHPPVRVNGKRIAEERIARETQHHPAATPEEARQEALLALAVRELLLDEARRLKIEAQPQSTDGKTETEDEALIRGLIEKQIVVPQPDEESCRRYFEANRKRFKSPDLYEARHILIAADPRDEEAFEAAAAKVESLIALLEEAPERFSDLAKEHSDCTSKESGGALGQIAQGQSVPEFETFLFNLEEGQLCPVPVRTRYGAHVLLLDRKILGESLPFETVEQDVAAYLKEESWRRAVHQYISILVGRADIEGLELEGAQSPLVQ